MSSMDLSRYVKITGFWSNTLRLYSLIYWNIDFWNRFSRSLYSFGFNLIKITLERFSSVFSIICRLRMRLRRIFLQWQNLTSEGRSISVCITNVHLADCRKRRNLPSKILRFQGFINFDLLRRYGRFFCRLHIQSKAFARQFLTGIPFVPVQFRAEYSLKKLSASWWPKPFWSKKMVTCTKQGMSVSMLLATTINFNTYLPCCTSWLPSWREYLHSHSRWIHRFWCRVKSRYRGVFGGSRGKSQVAF